MKNIMTLWLILVVLAVGTIGGSFVYGGAGSQLVNVKEYGAVGDGVTDDTVAIRTAIANAGGAGAAQPRVVFFPVGQYVISKPIFLGEFVSSGNGQGSFSWAGESRFWGGAVGNAKSGLHLVGETDVGAQSRIIFQNTVSSPMLVVIGGADIKVEKLQLDGLYDHDPNQYARASEGIFVTGGTRGFTLEQTVMNYCQRAVRIGNAVHWPEDPITFTSYEVQDSYPTTTGGWMIDQVTLLGSLVVNCGTGISFESEQCLSCALYNTHVYNDAVEGQGYYLHSGHFAAYEVYMGGLGKAGIYVPADCGRNSFAIYSGHTEMNTSGLAFRKERSSGEEEIGKYVFRNFDGAQSMDVRGAAQVVIDGGDNLNINLLENTNGGEDMVQILDIRNAWITGKVGQAYNVASAGKVVFSAENTRFEGFESITTPWNAYFDNHKVNKIVNCVFSGVNFLAAVQRLNYQGIGMFSEEAAGDSQFSLGVGSGNTNSIYADTLVIDHLKGAYRRSGSVYAADTSGSSLQQGDVFLSYSTFSGEVADTPVDLWTERFAAESNGGIWTIKVDGHRLGSSSAAPVGGTWSRGDIVYNSNVASTGPYAWIYTGSSWRALQ